MRCSQKNFEVFSGFLCHQSLDTTGLNDQLVLSDLNFFQFTENLLKAALTKFLLIWFTLVQPLIYIKLSISANLIGLWNANAAYNTKAFLFDNRLDVMLISETHLTERSHIPGFTIYDTQHPNGAAHELSLIHIQMCIRDRFRNMKFYVCI